MIRADQGEKAMTPISSDELIERPIRESISNIEAHVVSLESLLSKFHDHAQDHKDGGAGLAQLEILSGVFEDLATGTAEPSLAAHPIWSEKERDTWSPFAVEVSDHLYALWPHVVELINFRRQTDKPHGFAKIVSLQRRFDALWSHVAPLPEWVQTPDDGREQDEVAHREYVASLPTAEASPSVPN